MATTKTEHEIEVYAAGEMVSGILRMLKEPTPIKVAMVSGESGDIVFTAALNDLRLTCQTFHTHPFFHSHLFTNLLGELLVRGNLDLFSSRVMDNNYDVLIKKYNHHDFGLRSKGNDILVFQFHASLIYHLLNESISQEIANEVSRIIISCPKKVRREDDVLAIAAFSDDKTFRLIVPKHSDIRLCFQKAIGVILNFHGIKGKEVFISSNMFNYEIQIKDTTNEKSP